MILSIQLHEVSEVCGVYQIIQNSLLPLPTNETLEGERAVKLGCGPPH